MSQLNSTSPENKPREMKNQPWQQSFHSVEKIKTNGDPVEIMGTSGEKLWELFKNLIPKEVVEEVAAEMAGRHDLELITLESIEKWVRFMGNNGFSILPKEAILSKSLERPDIQLTAANYGFFQDGVEVGRIINSLHAVSEDEARQEPNSHHKPESPEESMVEYQKNGFAGTFTFRLLDAGGEFADLPHNGDFVDIPKTVIVLLDILVTYLQAKDALEKAKVNKEEVTGIFLGTNGHRIYSFTKIIAQLLDLPVEAIHYLSMNGCASVPVGLIEYFKLLEEQGRDTGYSLIIGGDNFVDNLKTTTFIIDPTLVTLDQAYFNATGEEVYRINPDLNAEIPADYVIKKSDGQFVMALGPVGVGGARLFSAGVGVMVLNHDRVKRRYAGESQEYDEAKGSPVTAPASPMLMPKWVVKAKEYKDAGTNRLIRFQFNKKKNPWPKAQMMGDTTKFTIRMAQANIYKALENAGITVEMLKQAAASHQPNKGILDLLAKYFQKAEYGGFPEWAMPAIAEEYGDMFGNSSAAAVLFALIELINCHSEHRITAEELILLVSVGYGNIAAVIGLEILDDPEEAPLPAAT